MQATPRGKLLAPRGCWKSRPGRDATIVFMHSARHWRRSGCPVGISRTAYNELKRLREAARSGVMIHSTQSDARTAGESRVSTQSTEEFGAGQAGANHDHVNGKPDGELGGKSGETPDGTFGWQMQFLRAGGWEVYYDGDCGFCRRWAARGARWCHPLIEWKNFRRLTHEQADSLARLAPRFDQAAYLIINRQLALPGFFAFRKLALASPRLWPLVPLVYFPGTRWLGPAVYRWIAHRYGPTNHCQWR